MAGWDFATSVTHVMRPLTCATTPFPFIAPFVMDATALILKPPITTPSLMPPPPSSLSHHAPHQSCSPTRSRLRTPIVEPSFSFRLKSGPTLWNHGNDFRCRWLTPPHRMLRAFRRPVLSHCSLLSDNDSVFRGGICSNGFHAFSKLASILISCISSLSTEISSTLAENTFLGKPGSCAPLNSRAEPWHVFPLNQPSIEQC